MGFPENPYVHMNLVTAPPPSILPSLEPRVQEYWKGRENVVEVHCEGCGATDVAKGDVIASDSITKARIHFNAHLERSHGRSPVDLIDWSWD